MVNSLEEQKELLVDAVLEIQKKLNSLKYLIEMASADKPENKVTIGVYNDLLFFIHGLLWDSIVINLYWLYDKKGQRSLYWYLNELEKSARALKQKIDIQREEIVSLEPDVKFVKKFRNKWVAHKDKEPFERAENFWSKDERLQIEQVERLVSKAANIVQVEHEIVDTTSSGVHKLLALIHLIFLKSPDFLKTMKDYGVLERMDYAELQTLRKSAN